MIWNYLTYEIKPLSPRKGPEKKRLLSQKEASIKYRVPALHIKWAIDSGRIDYEFNRRCDRRLVVDNARLYYWARCHRRTKGGQLDPTN